MTEMTAEAKNRRAWDEVSAYDDARAEHRRVVEDANAAVRARRARLERELTDLLALSHAAEQPIDLGLIKRLYWETDVPANLLATMLGLKHGSQVYEFVGAYAVVKECIHCRVRFERTATSRTDALRNNWWLRVCDSCDARENQERAALAERMATLACGESEDERIEREQRQAALDAGQLSRVYVEFPGDGHTYEVRGGRIVDGKVQS